jgi:formamidopyrimidine-DNA glycosylase
MPELPEVDAARALLRRVAAGRTISRVWCANDPLVFEALSARRFRRALVGRRVVSAGGTASISGSSWTGGPGRAFTSA